MTDKVPVEILLVEDNPTDAELCIRSLKKQHLANRLIWVKDGAEALDVLFRRGAHAGDADAAPKLVLLDLRLPKVDGVDVLRALKADSVLKLVPVVVLTSSKEDRDIRRCWELGVNSYVQKPVQFDEFARVVAALGMYWLLTNRSPEITRNPPVSPTS